MIKTRLSYPYDRYTYICEDRLYIEMGPGIQRMNKQVPPTYLDLFLYLFQDKVGAQAKSHSSERGGQGRVVDGKTESLKNECILVIH